jgi:hypothetical protein
MQKPLLTGNKIWVSDRSVARITYLLLVDNFLFQPTSVSTRPIYYQVFNLSHA